MLTIDMTAASRPIMLAGKEYQMAPLSDLDIAELDQWLKAKVIQTAIDAVPPDASEQTRQAILDSANRVALELSWMSPEGAKQMRTLDGMARLVWQSIKRQHPETTHIDIRKALTDARTVNEAVSAFDSLNQAGESSKKKNQGGKRKAGRHQQQQKRRK